MAQQLVDGLVTHSHDDIYGHKSLALQRHHINRHMTSFANDALQSAYLHWLCPTPDSYAIAFTMNYRAGIPHAVAVEAAKQFWQRVDHAVYPARQVKRGMRVPRVCMLEGQQGVRNWHYHVAAALPHGWDEASFKTLLIGTWEGLREAGNFSDVQSIYWATGWVNYICKDIRHSTDGLCLATSHLRRLSDHPSSMG